jgi:hypothetical protein
MTGMVSERADMMTPVAVANHNAFSIAEIGNPSTDQQDQHLGTLMIGSPAFGVGDMAWQLFWDAECTSGRPR